MTDAATSDASDWKQYVTFTVDDRLFGVEIVQVREIKQWTPTTPLPNQPTYTRGVLNLRGTIVPVHDLRARFGGALTEATETHVVLIAKVAHQSVGILVDAVSDIVNVTSEEVRSIPPTARDSDFDSIGGLVSSGEEMIALLDLAHLFPVAADEAA